MDLRQREALCFSRNGIEINNNTKQGWTRNRKSVIGGPLMIRLMHIYGADAAVNVRSIIVKKKKTEKVPALTNVV